MNGAGHVGRSGRERHPLTDQLPRADLVALV